MAKAQRVSIELPKGGQSYGLCWVEERKALANVIIVTGMEETSSRYAH